MTASIPQVRYQSLLNAHHVSFISHLTAFYTLSPKQSLLLSMLQHALDSFTVLHLLSLQIFIIQILTVLFKTRPVL